MPSGLPNPDPETFQRLLASPADGAAIMSAVTAVMIGALGQAQTAAILREWADEIEHHIPPMAGHG